MKFSRDLEICKKIEELSVPILESISVSDAIQNFKPYYHRYFDNKYCICFNDKSENNDILLRFHTNKLILVTLAEGHDILRKDKVIQSINFNVNGTNMLDITVSGKKKAGAKMLKKDSLLCTIRCEDGKEYPVYACIPSSLIEVNSLILENPQLLKTSYKELGYIGVLYPKIIRSQPSSVDVMVSKLNLLSEQDYKVYLNSRNESVIITERIENDIASKEN